MDTDTLLVNSSGVLPQRPDFDITENLVCEGITRNYSVPPVPNANDYSWSVTVSPFVSNQNSITDWTSTLDLPLFVYVSAQNECGNSLDTCLNIMVQALPRPDFQLRDSLSG
ncbi:MAG: hypothetical protein R2784_18375 [Saprospiraceae bacterium]